MDSGEQELLTRLENDLDPEASKVEYYATMAFDERLLTLLELEPSVTHITADRITTEIPASPLFAPTGVRPVEFLVDNPDTLGEKQLESIPLPCYAFTLSGTALFERKSVALEATITPDDTSKHPIHIQNDGQDPDKFFVYSSRGDDIYSEPHTTKSLLILFGSLVNLNPVGFEIYLDKKLGKEASPRAYRDVLKQLWTTLGEESGSKETVRSLIHRPDTHADDPAELLKVRHTAKETATQSIIHLTLEHTTQYPDLDAEDAHILELTYVHDGSDKSLAQDAERVIASVVSPPELIGMSATRANQGRRTKLDPNDPTVMELFVDWFDALVSA